MQLFEYRPLPPDETTIRLIRLVGREEDANDTEQTPAVSDAASTTSSSSDAGPSAPPPDIGTIFHVPIASAPPYSALSYVWGDPTPRHTVRFGGALVHIGDNLNAAVNHLRPRGKDAPPINVWIDALCINQADPVEKAKQISHMREIYTRASAVVAWLGSAEDDSDIAMKWIDYYGGRACDLGIGSKKELYLRRLLYAIDHADRQVEGQTHRALHKQPCHLDHHDHHTNVLEDDETGELEAFVRSAREQLAGETDEARRALEALRKLFLRDYWNRVWVIQEVKQGAGVTFVCGSVAVQEDHVHHALRLMRNFAQYAKFSGAKHDAAQHPNPEREAIVSSSPLLPSRDDDDDAIPALVPTAKAIKLLKARRASGCFELAYLLRNFWGAGATDARDRVFALLGLASDAERLGIRPDYVKPFAHVFADTTAALYKAGYMDLLAYCRPVPGVKPGEEADGRPSWVPRFELPVTRERLQQRGLLRGPPPVMSVLQPAFAAAAGHAATCAFEDDGVAGLRTMSCKAVLVGEVGAVGEVWKPHDVGRWLQDLMNLSQATYNPSTAGSGATRIHHRGGLLREPVRNTKIDHLRAVLRTAVADQELRRGAVKPRLADAALDKAVNALKHDRDLVSLSVEGLVSRGLKTYVQQLEACAFGRRPFAGDGGLFGIGPCEMEAGDLVYVLTGATVPYVLRRGADGRLRMIGDAYVHEKMDGEAMADSPRLHTITIH